MSGPPDTQVDGLVVVDKPAGMTSHDVVARCRRAFGQRRVGHGGTLDPDATGVLLVGLGRATRLLQWVSALDKAYTCTVVLGVATTTLDAAGEVTGTWDMTGVTLDAARAAAATLTGSIEQVPPMVSAVKVGGRRLHELARQGVEVERAARPVRVDRFAVDLRGPGSQPGTLELAASVVCSSGTYVRSLAADLGAALGGGAHLTDLRRTRIGGFDVADATPLDDVGPDAVLPPAAAVGHLPPVTVAGPLAGAVGHGKVLERAALGATGPGPWAVHDAAGALLAVYEAHGDGRAKPAVVLAAG
ncbi:MAG TPA: tRNA pseudouridine(55) synthase TruB [Acidimicrobiales bacterium]|nr:tRNA pseudouridine(55) synthase TruB [Acidimicrobiales bacterium]